jgi:hypothetical protein
MYCIRKRNSWTPGSINNIKGIRKFLIFLLLSMLSLLSVSCSLSTDRNFLWSHRSEEVVSMFTIIQTNVDADATKSGESCSANTVLVHVGLPGLGWEGSRSPRLLIYRLPMTIFFPTILEVYSSAFPCTLGPACHRELAQTGWGNWPASRSYPFAIPLYLLANSFVLQDHMKTCIPSIVPAYGIELHTTLF